MLILRVLENVLQPSFLQKMTILNLLEKISRDPEIVIDIFVNYDCDVDAPNIFERYCESLLYCHAAFKLFLSIFTTWLITASLDHKIIDCTM